MPTNRNDSWRLLQLLLLIATAFPSDARARGACV